MSMYNCETHCVCGMRLVLCESDVVVKIRGKHRKMYDLPYPGDEWVARCRQCGRHYLLDGHGNPQGERSKLYPHFFYHTIISWNQLRRREQGLKPVHLQELEVYWKKYVPELSWEAALLNAFETDLDERNRLSRSRKSFVFGRKYADLLPSAPFRLENDLAFPIPYIADRGAG